MENLKLMLKLYDGVDCDNWSEKEIDDYCRKEDTKAIIDWQEHKSFDVYKTKGYVYDNLFSYLYISKQMCEDVKTFLREQGYDLKKMSVFDYYNGNGLTTYNMMQDFGDVEFFNDVESQVNVFNQLLAEKGLQEKKSTSYNGQDIFMVLNCIEHYFRPKEFLKEIMDSAKDCEYLVISHGFNKSYWCGHYQYYLIDDELVENVKVWEILEKELMKKYDMVATGTEQKMKIFRKKKVS